MLLCLTGHPSDSITKKSHGFALIAGVLSGSFDGLTKLMCGTVFLFRAHDKIVFGICSGFIPLLRFLRDLVQFLLIVSSLVVCLSFCFSSFLKVLDRSHSRFCCTFRFLLCCCSFFSGSLCVLLCSDQVKNLFGIHSISSGKVIDHCRICTGQVNLIENLFRDILQGICQIVSSCFISTLCLCCFDCSICSSLVSSFDGF